MSLRHMFRNLQALDEIEFFLEDQTARKYPSPQNSDGRDQQGICVRRTLHRRQCTRSDPSRFHSASQTPRPHPTSRTEPATPPSRPTGPVCSRNRLADLPELASTKSKKALSYCI